MVDIGQELGTILTERWSQRPTPQPRTARSSIAKRRQQRAATTRIEPALSPTITRKLSRVIPANLQIDARWDAIRKRASGEEEEWQKRPLPFSDDCVGGCPGDGKTRAVSPIDSGRRKYRRERQLRSRHRGFARRRSPCNRGDCRGEQEELAGVREKFTTRRSKRRAEAGSMR